MKKTITETPEERQERYRQKAKAAAERQRNALRQAKRNGTMGHRNLAFLADILKGLGLSQKAFAEGIGYTQQGVQYHFMADDMRLSSVQEGLQYFGYRITARLETGDAGQRIPITVQAPAYRVEGIRTRPGEAKLPDYLTRSIEQGGRVAFVGEAILHSGRTLGSICTEAGIDLTSFRFFIIQDDFRVSYLYRIASVLHATVVWTVMPME